MTQVSVCMASYNGEQFIGKQIRSILSQLSPDDELIISDDGSTDNTLQIIQALCDNRIKLTLNSNRKGPVGNFENALRYASGQLIFLADQDDVWFPNKISQTCLLLENADLVLSDCEVVDERGCILHNSFFKTRRSRRGFWSNLYKNSYMGCCMAFRRDVLAYALPFPSRIHMHDWWIGLLVEAKGRVVFYEKPLIRYVRHGNNASPTGGIGYSFTKQIENRFFLLVSLIMRLLM